MHTLFWFHLLASSVHIASFVLLLQVIPQENERTYQLVIPYATYEEELGMQFLHENVFGPISIATLLLVNEIITALSHISGVVGFGLYSEQMVADGRHLEIIRRYIEYAITAAILEVVIYVLVGGRDINLLFAIVVTNIVIQLLGYMLERSPNKQRKIYLNVAGFVLLLVPIVSFFTVGSLGDTFMPLAVYYAVLYGLFGLHSLLDIVSEEWRALVDKDIGFLILGVSTKEILTWMVVALQAKLILDHKVPSDSSLADILDVVSFLIWTPLLGILAMLTGLFLSSYISVRDNYETVRAQIASV